MDLTATQLYAVAKERPRTIAKKGHSKMNLRKR